MTGLRKEKRRVLHEAITRAAVEGLTQAEAAKRIGVSRATISTAAKTIGVRFQRAVNSNSGSGVRQHAAHLAYLYREGFTLQQIGDRYGVTRERVRQILRQDTAVTANDGGFAKRLEERRTAAARRREQDCLKRNGCTLAQLKELRQIGRGMMRAGLGRERTPTGAFARQRCTAVNNRGIPWELTLWEWWTIWKASGLWDRRGRGQGYVMARHNDTGPYAVGNVSIVPARHNSSDTKRNKSGLPIGVRLVGKRFHAERMVNGHTRFAFGFETAEQAHAAYLSLGSEAA